MRGIPRAGLPPTTTASSPSWAAAPSGERFSGLAGVAPALRAHRQN